MNKGWNCMIERSCGELKWEVEKFGGRNYSCSIFYRKKNIKGEEYGQNGRRKKIKKERIEGRDEEEERGEKREEGRREVQNHFLNLKSH